MESKKKLYSRAMLKQIEVPETISNSLLEEVYNLSGRLIGLPNIFKQSLEELSSDGLLGEKAGTLLNRKLKEYKREHSLSIYSQRLENQYSMSFF